MTEELHKFLNDHNVMYPVDGGGYIITFNGFKCLGQLTTMPNVEMLAIRPCNQAWDIGAGAGQTIFREFKKPDNTSYNQAIDDAIQALRKENEIIHPYVQIIIINLIPILEELKKKQ